jgi:UDP-2,4-diacetamido-2,4,6-trideoxy-beta-L-altropyranose hydrolase
MGHAMRCLALAQEWIRSGGHAVFVGHFENTVLKNQFIAEGIEVISFDTGWPTPYDIEMTLHIVSKDKATIPWIVIDGYHFDTTYQETIRSRGFFLIVVDDIHHLSHYDADIVLNQNITANTMHYKCNSETRVLLGTKYALLNQKFFFSERPKRAVPVKAKRVLITLGGGDQIDILTKVLKAVRRLGSAQMEFAVVTGSNDLPDDSTLHEDLSRCNHKCRFLHIVRDMPGLMTWADMAVSAAGSTCWELAYMGVPTLTVVVSKNQQSVADTLDAKGVFKTLGCGKQLDDAGLANELFSLSNDREKRKRIIENAQNLVDGKGASRVVRVMKALSVPAG